MNHIQCRVSYLSNLEPIQLYEHVLSIYPEFNLFQSQCGELIEIILKHEYGNNVVDVVSTTSVERQQATKDKRAAKVKSDRRAQKEEEIIQSKEKLSKIESEMQQTKRVGEWRQEGAVRIGNFDSGEPYFSSKAI